MRFVRIDPPGSFCSDEALRDMIKPLRPKTFVDIGCGGGRVSKMLCGMGMSGIGIDFSKPALALAGETLAGEIDGGVFRLLEGDVNALRDPPSNTDLAVSYMVIEHVEDDVGFAKQAAAFVKPGGHVVIAAPGRADRWSFEDDTVGHLRRYERHDLARVLREAGLQDVEAWSVAVPTSNLLFRVSDWPVRRSAGEAVKLGQSQREQTETSGIRDIPWKTTFPAFVRLVLNRYSLYPLFVVQRLFYGTNLGLTVVARGRVADVAR